MNWTDEQKKAIELRDKNILVAAAAGSGKTAVLVERIKRLVIEEKVGIDKMLIVTFTNAAASEMKEKIRTAINKEIEGNSKDSQYLRQQLALMSRASISTFHAFALDVIRRFFYMINIEPNFRICDEAEAQIIKGEALDQLLDESFQEGSEEFYDFLKKFSSDRNEEKVKEMITKVYSTILSLPDPWKWLDEKIDNLSCSEAEFKDGMLMNYLWKYIKVTLEKALKQYELAVEALEDLPRLAEKLIVEELNLINCLIDICKEKDYDNFMSVLATYKAARLVAKKEEKDYYNEIKPTVDVYRKKGQGLVKQLKENICSDSLSNLIGEVNETAVDGKFLRDMVVRYDELFSMGKREKNFVDFNDIEHYCIAILRNPEVADFYREKFQYIFIDEYQDTNLLQEEIIGKIKRKNNLFMVGDIKQSIYKFRLAEPSIFKHKYDVYGKGDDDYSEKIDLNKNYRSKATIINYINEVFSNIMVDYDDNAKLYEGAPNINNITFDVETKVVDVSTLGEADIELQDLKKAEIEALEVCKIIRNSLGKEYTDSKTGEIKELKKKDIVILLRSMKNFADLFYKIMREQEIEAYVDDNEGYFDTMEINVFMNLLSIIDNKMQDIPLISIMRSEIFNFSIDELALIRSEFKNCAYYEAVMAYSKSGNNEKLAERCSLVLAKIEEYRQQSWTMPLHKFIWELMIDTNYYMIMGAMPAGSQRQGNLRALVDKALKFQENGQGSLYSFMKYIENVKLRKVSIGQVKLLSENSDLVRIMTIHKSKGLEFPMVIVSGLGRKLNYGKSGKGVTLHKDIGIGLSLINPKERWHKQTLIQKLIDVKIKEEEEEEEVRVLYVALTRAKDILVLTGTYKDGVSYLEKKDLDTGDTTTYLGMLGNDTGRLELVNCGTLIASEDIDEKDLTVRNVDLWKNEKIQVDETVYDQVAKRLEYIYPYNNSLTVKSKYSVSEMNKSKEEEGKYTEKLAIPKFMEVEKNRKLSSSEIGTLYHSILERINFKEASEGGSSYIKKECESYIEKGIFTSEEIKALDFKKIEKFFNSSIGLRCIEAFKRGQFFRETPFNLVATVSEEEVLVQGVIDGYFIDEDGQLVLLDYKAVYVDYNKDIDEELKRIKIDYKKQIELYSEALEKIKEVKVKEAYLYLLNLGEVVIMK